MGIVIPEKRISLFLELLVKTFYGIINERDLKKICHPRTLQLFNRMTKRDTNIIRSFYFNFKDPLPASMPTTFPHWNVGTRTNKHLTRVGPIGCPVKQIRVLHFFWNKIFAGWRDLRHRNLSLKYRRGWLNIKL